MGRKKRHELSEALSWLKRKMETGEETEKKRKTKKSRVDGWKGDETKKKERKTPLPGKASLEYTIANVWDVFERYIAPNLNDSDMKILTHVSRTCRNAVKKLKKKRAYKKLQFKVDELSSTSALEWAISKEGGYPFGERVRLPWGEYFTVSKESFIANVAKGGDVYLLRWLREEKQWPWDKYVCTEAARFGQFDCLEYALRNGGAWNEPKIASNASMNSHVECLKLMLEFGSLMDSKACSNAALFGHLECLNLANEYGCYWDEKTCSNVAFK